MTISKVSIEEVKYISKLCRLSFSNEEINTFTREFENILSYFNDLNDLDLKDATNNYLEDELKPIVRKDEVIENSHTNLFINVKSMNGSYIEVPKIL